MATSSALARDISSQGIHENLPSWRFCGAFLQKCVATASWSDGPPQYALWTASPRTYQTRSPKCGTNSIAHARPRLRHTSTCLETCLMVKRRVHLQTFAPWCEKRSRTHATSNRHRMMGDARFQRQHLRHLMCDTPRNIFFGFDGFTRSCCNVDGVGFPRSSTHSDTHARMPGGLYLKALRPLSQAPLLQD